MLEPTPYHASNPQRDGLQSPAFQDREANPTATEISFPDVSVGEPFGADHVIAVAGAQPLRRLMPALVAAHRQHDIPGVMTALASERQVQPLKIRAARHLHVAVVAHWKRDGARATCARWRMAENHLYGAEKGSMH